VVYAFFQRVEELYDFYSNFLDIKVFNSNGAVTHPALRILRKCENLICVQAGVCRLQRLMGKPTSSRKNSCFLTYNFDFPPFLPNSEYFIHFSIT
jgi:hypothetical protein